MGEDEDEEEEEEDADDGGDADDRGDAAAPLAVMPEEIDEEGPLEVIPNQEALMPHEVILADVEPEMPELRLFHALMRDYEENPLRLKDEFDDLDDDLSEEHLDMDE
jgi:hypothetical protein